MSDSGVCPTCGGTLEEREIQLDLRHKGRLVIIEGVPAQVCRDCGERLVSAASSKAIDVLLESGARPVREIAVPVLSFRHVAQA
ncbi:MAG: YgiT-type zinc finger protein [Clostridia bacterium]|nr:YgiT-type zinc finger protein [Clostridia bacterium]MDH7573797.1 YgiT-type zinc finger protein [Clostridia bacterium]